MFLQPSLLPDIQSIAVTIEERNGSRCNKQTFERLAQIPERVPPSFGPPEMQDHHMLYLGNRVRETYETRQKVGVFQEPYIDATDGSNGSSRVQRTVTIKVSYAGTRAWSGAADLTA